LHGLTVDPISVSHRQSRWINSDLTGTPPLYFSSLDENDLLTNIGKYGKIISNSNQFNQITHYFEKGI
jgi:hypothetical protein